MKNTRNVCGIAAYICLGFLAANIWLAALHVVELRLHWNDTAALGLEVPYRDWPVSIHLANLLGLLWRVFWFGFFHRFFRVVQKNGEFTAVSVRHLRLLSAACLAKFVVDMVFLPWEWPGMAGTDLRQLVLLGHRATYLLASVFALGAAWLLDEGRRLREQQELTV